MKTCPDCLSRFKHSQAGRSAKKAGGAWGRGRWPTSVYHSEATRKCAKHQAQCLADTAARRAGLSQATPVWADRAAIRAVYVECMRLTQETGVPHEVDHIVPLNGVNVCGLHVHWNLRPLKATANREKSNRMESG